MLSVEGHRELQAAVLAMKAANRDLRSQINKATRRELGPIWKQEVASRLGGVRPLNAKLLQTYRATSGNPPQALAAQSTRPVGRGALVPSRDYGPWEFGTANREAWSTYDRKNRKGSGHHKVTRRASRGLPHRRTEGRVVYPAFADAAPRMVALWVQLIVKLYNDAAEGKGA